MIKTISGITSSLYDDDCGTSWVDPDGEGTGVWTPLKNHKNIGFLSNTGPDPLKNHKAAKPAFNVGPSSAPQRFVGGQMMAFIMVFRSSLQSSTKKNPKTSNLDPL